MYRRGRYKHLDNADRSGIFTHYFSHNNNNVNSENKLEVTTLVGLARQERSLVPSLTALAKEEAGQTNRAGETEEEEKVCFNEKSLIHERHERLRPSNL